MRQQLTARSPSPKPVGWSGAGSAGTPGRTAVGRMGPLARTNATANRKDASSLHKTRLQHKNSSYSTTKTFIGTRRDGVQYYGDSLPSRFASVAARYYKVTCRRNASIRGIV